MKLIKQDLQILLAVVLPVSANKVCGQLKIQTTREYLLLIRDGHFHFCPYAAVFCKDSDSQSFWLAPAADPNSIRAMHIHMTHVSHGSPHGSVVVLDAETLRCEIARITALPVTERLAEISRSAHRSLTHTQFCSTSDFIRWLKDGDSVWK